jgi:urease accessory protein
MSPHRIVTLAFGLILLLSLATPASAHPGHGGHAFVDGWQHPFTGVDHLLAMVAVGLLAVRIGGKAIWLMPVAFMVSMLLGGVAAECGVPLPGVEHAIMASVLVLGLLIAATSVVPLSAGVLLVALFAVFHGHAHATEMVQGISLAAYAAGFLLATVLLHITGIVGGLALSRWLNASGIRAVGGMISVMGVLLFCGVI